MLHPILLTPARRGWHTNSKTMYCSNCGKVVNEEAQVCLNCGVEVGRGKKFCANCGVAHDPEACICLNCGVAFKNEESNNDSTVMGCVKRGFRDAFKVSGRMSRAEFWWFVLALCVCYIGYSILTAILSTFGVGLILALLAIPLYLLIFVVEGLAIIRRLHDIGKSGWYSLLYFLFPLTCGISAIVSIVYACQPGDQFENEYGPVPQN